MQLDLWASWRLGAPARLVIDVDMAAVTLPTPIYREPSECAICTAVRPIIARKLRSSAVVDPCGRPTLAVVDLCGRCTVALVRQRRFAGQHLPPGFEWVP